MTEKVTVDEKEKKQKSDIKKQIEDNNFKRYSLSVVSGQEFIVVENLKERIKKQNLDQDIIDFFTPVVNEVSIKKGKKVIKPKKLYPGYVFVKSKMNEKIWYVVRNTPGVRLIVGADTIPIPLTDKEFDAIMKHINDNNEKAEYFVPYKIGDVVTIKEGDFLGMSGVVKDVDPEKMSIMVNIEILGRLTPIVLAFDKVDHNN